MAPANLLTQNNYGDNFDSVCFQQMLDQRGGRLYRNDSEREPQKLSATHLLGQWRFECQITLADSLFL